MQNTITKWKRKIWPKRHDLSKWVYNDDGFAVRKKTVDFLKDPAFLNAWETSKLMNTEAWKTGVPDVRWRAHTCCWAAKHGLLLDGDFVECGVFTGLYSVTLAHFLDFAKVNKKLWLFDTYNGIPVDTAPAVEARSGSTSGASSIKNTLYFDCYELAQRNFKPFPNAHMVRGILPASFDQIELSRIAYLSVDLNHAHAYLHTSGDCGLI